MATEESLKHKKLAADLFAKARLEFGITHDDLAGRIGICGRHAQHVEYGDRQPSAAIFLSCLEVMNPKLFNEIKRFIRTPMPQTVATGDGPLPLGGTELAQ